MDTVSRFALRCWEEFFNPRAYYYLRISYQNHASIMHRTTEE
jgi:hypothetical protein